MGTCVPPTMTVAVGAAASSIATMNAANRAMNGIHSLRVWSNIPGRMRRSARTSGIRIEPRIALPIEGPAPRGRSLRRSRRL